MRKPDWVITKFHDDFGKGYCSDGLWFQLDWKTIKKTWWYRYIWIKEFLKALNRVEINICLKGKKII